MIRRFQKRDLTRLHQLDQVCFSPEIAYSRAQLQYFLLHPNCSCWIAEPAPGRLAGFLIIERVRLYGRPAGHIVTLDVDPMDRRRGWGRLLMHTAEQQMRQEGVSIMSLEVAENNAAALHFYRSLGFAVYGRIQKYYGGRVDAEVMQKSLEPA
jgi:ribosomal-protein-alanine N-acetyltransferase